MKVSHKDVKFNIEKRKLTKSSFSNIFSCTRSFSALPIFPAFSQGVCFLDCSSTVVDLFVTVFTVQSSMALNNEIKNLSIVSSLHSISISCVSLVYYIKLHYTIIIAQSQMIIFVLTYLHLGVQLGASTHIFNKVSKPSSRNSV